MDKDEIARVVSQEFNSKKNMKDLGENDNFFEAGVSSLTIIELQIKVEKALGLSVKTSDLMRLSTIGSWVDAYWQQQNANLAES